jgi:hypothetical protein
MRIAGVWSFQRFWMPLIAAGLQAAWLIVLQAVVRSAVSSVFGRLQFGPGRARSDGTPSSKRIDLPAGRLSTLRQNSAPFGPLPLPSPLMAAWCNEHGTGIFFYSADWVECMARNLAKFYIRMLRTRATVPRWWYCANPCALLIPVARDNAVRINAANQLRDSTHINCCSFSLFSENRRILIR